MPITVYEQMMDRSVPSAEVVKAIRSLVNSVLGHFGPLKKDRSDQGPKYSCDLTAAGSAIMPQINLGFKLQDYHKMNI